MRSVGTPRVVQQLVFQEKLFSLVGGPDDPHKKLSLYEEFRLVAQEAETFVSFGSSLPTTTVDDWLDRLQHANALRAGANHCEAAVKHLLTASALHVKAVRVNEQRVRQQKQADGLYVPDLERLGALAACFETLRDKYFNAPFGGEDFSAVDLRFSGASHPGDKIARLKPGPRPDRATALRVRTIVERVAGAGPWKNELDKICEDLDEEQIAPPKTWRKRDLESWADAATLEKELAKKAIKHHLKLARP